MDKERTLDSSAVSAALLRGYISSQKRFFFSPKKNLCNLLPYIQNDFLMFEVLGARIVGRITQ